MAAAGVSSVKSEKRSRNFTESLSSAGFEWMLLLMLLVNALLSFLTTKFARYCGLQTPCTLCSRLDHILGKKRLGFYWDTICRRHKSEISSLVLCHAHCKLVDVRGICENCLFSFATINESNIETFRLLVGKLGADSESGLSDEKDFHSEGHQLRKSTTKLCSCCRAPYIWRDPRQTLTQTTSIMSQLVELDVPFSGVIDALKGMGDGSSRRSNRETGGLSHVGYSELKISSDSESEVPFSDDDEINTLNSRQASQRQNYTVRPVKEDSSITISSDTIPARLGEQASTARQNLTSLPENNIDAGEGLKDEPTGPTIEPVSGDISEVKDKEASSSVTEFISFDNMHDSDPNNVMTLEEQSLGKLGVAVEDEEPEPMEMAQKPMEANQTSGEASPQVPNLGDVGVGDYGRQLSGISAERWLAKDSSSSMVREEMKSLLSQPHLMSPKVSLCNEEDSSKALDALYKRISLERNESSLSVDQDGSTVSEIEGESTIERLKRQVEHDRRALGALYKELEEERNASSVAANQAMAMITRLQEEKSTLQMEASQYLRMMEEQAEYDMEALQKSNDLLAEREKDIQDLEDELEFYRINYGDRSDVLESSDFQPKDDISILGIEDERLHILNCLNRLEKELARGSDDDKKASDSSERMGNNLWDEVLLLHRRLEALEADKNFLQQTAKHLRIGEEGLQFVRHIASRLNKLRSSEQKG